MVLINFCELTKLATKQPILYTLPRGSVIKQVPSPVVIIKSDEWLTKLFNQ